MSLWRNLKMKGEANVWREICNVIYIMKKAMAEGQMTASDREIQSEERNEASKWKYEAVYQNNEEGDSGRPFDKWRRSNMKKKKGKWWNMTMILMILKKKRTILLIMKEMKWRKYIDMKNMKEMKREGKKGKWRKYRTRR